METIKYKDNFTYPDNWIWSHKDYPNFHFDLDSFKEQIENVEQPSASVDKCKWEKVFDRTTEAQTTELEFSSSRKPHPTQKQSPLSLKQPLESYKNKTNNLSRRNLQSQLL